jgi:hypothetical protein
LFKSAALNEAQIFRMSELNSLFNTIHENFDFRINKAIRNQTTYLRVLNAQLFSRLGFVTDQIEVKKEQILRDIERRALQINSPEAECILDAMAGIENAVEYAGYNINGIIGEVMFNVNEIEKDFFYPLIHTLQLESNTMQWSVKSELRRFNPVTGMTALIERLNGDYEVLLALYDVSVRNIEREMVAMNSHMNDVKASMFPQLNGVRDYFGFTANIIRDNLPLCTE